VASNVVDPRDPTGARRVMLVAPEAPEIYFEDYGAGQLEHGVSRHLRVLSFHDGATLGRLDGSGLLAELPSGDEEIPQVSGPCSPLCL